MKKSAWFTLLVVGIVLANDGFQGAAVAESLRGSHFLGPPTIGYRTGWPVDTGMLVDRSSPAVGNLDGDSDLEIVVGTRGHKVYAFNPDGSALPGWPVTVSAEVNSSPAIGDINGDGWNEVVVGVGWEDRNNDGGIYAFSHTGQILPGWPVLTQDENLGHDGHPDGVFATPALADLDDDGKLDVIVSSFDEYLYALKYDGTAVAGWPFFMWDSSWSSPAVGDLDRDGEVEIVIGAYTHAGFPPGLPTVDGGGILWVLDRHANVESGWPRAFDLHFDSSPALGDLDGDGDREIVIGTGQEANATRGRSVYAFHHNGTNVSGWPVATEAYVWPSPALGDLDGDGSDEVTISCADGYLYAWDGNGSLLWKVRPLNESDQNGPMVGSPVIADLDNNSDLEVVVPIGWDLVAYNHDGTLFKYGFETQMRLHTLFSLGSTPTIADIDHNNRLDVLIGSANLDFSEGRLYAWELPSAAVPGALPWPMFRRTNHRTGANVVAPRLSVAPDSLVFLYDGVGSPPTQRIRVANGGDGELAWQVSDSPTQTIIMPASGVVGWAQETVSVTVQAPAYQPGTILLGNIVITGTVDGQEVSGSPKSIPVTVYLGPIHRVFLPITVRDDTGD